MKARLRLAIPAGAGSASVGGQLRPNEIAPHASAGRGGIVGIDPVAWLASSDLSSSKPSTLALPNVRRRRQPCHCRWRRAQQAILRTNPAGPFQHPVAIETNIVALWESEVSSRPSPSSRARGDRRERQRGGRPILPSHSPSSPTRSIIPRRCADSTKPTNGGAPAAPKKGKRSCHPLVPTTRTNWPSR